MKEIVLSSGNEEIESISVDKSPFRIGKSPVCELQLDGKGIPRHQCDIVEAGTGYKLIDRSGKGTKVDRKKVDEARLSSKSVIKIGDYKLQLRDIPAGAVSTVTAVFGGTDPKASRRARNQVLSLVGKSFLGPVKAVLDGRTFTVGSDPSNDLVLKDKFISKFHCRFFQKDGQWSVEDLDSTNGTKVNGASVSTTKIEPGMVVEVGKLKMSVLAGKKDIEYPGHCGIISEDPIMAEVFRQIDIAARSDAEVLITGETGSGKEVVAQAIYRLGKRATGPFLAQNCSAISKDLIDSELFGHVKGAFTGAVKDKIGLFEAASGGTLFLDEIGELPLDLQSKLLRALSMKEIRRVGENEPRKVDTRIIAATNRSLVNMVKEGAFREDLFYRLVVLFIDIPPLRKRPKDIPLLARYFLETLTRDSEKKLSKAGIKKLSKHDYPGNVRELYNTITRAIGTCKSDTIEQKDIVFLSATLADRKAEAEIYLEGRPWNEHLKRLLIEALERNSWNQAETARAFSMDRNQIARLMKKHGIERPK